MKRRLLSEFIVVVLIVGILGQNQVVNVAAEETSTNLLENGEFEDGMNGWTDTWSTNIITDNPVEIASSARPQVLSNGWIVIASESDSVISLTVSKDDGKTFVPLCRSTIGKSGGSYSISSIGNTIYLLGDSTTCLTLDTIEATSVQNIDVVDQNRKYITSDTDIHSCSMAVNPVNGELGIVWSRKLTDTGLSYNLSFMKTTDGGSSFMKQDGTPYSVDDLTNSSLATENYKNPKLTYTNDGYPIIVYEKATATEKSLKIIYADDSGWKMEVPLTNSGSYDQVNPSITTQRSGIHTGRIWTTWQGKDSTDRLNDNIHCKYSDDNGITWNMGGVSGDKITSGSVNVSNPTITTNSQGNVFILWQGLKSPYTDIFGISQVDDVWGDIRTLTNSQTGDIIMPVTCDNRHDFDFPIVAWKNEQNYDERLLHFDGDTNSTIFIDAGNTTSWINNGNAQIVTDEKKFGSGSGYFDGNGSYISTTDDMLLSDKDFTIDLNIKRNNISGELEYIYGKGSDATNENMSYVLQINADNTLTASVVINNSIKATITSSQSIEDTLWHHIAFLRNGSNLLLYIDGVQSGSLAGVTSMDGLSVSNGSGESFSIGALGSLESNYFNGYVDEFRWSIGNTKWKNNFIVPTAEYSALSGHMGIGYFNRFTFGEEPIIGESSVNEETLITSNDTITNPRIFVSDPDNDTLECKYFIDDETTPRDTKIVLSTGDRKEITFDGFDTSAMLGGQHKIRYEVYDGFQTLKKSAYFSVRKSIQIEKGYTFTVFLKPDGTVWACGSNDYGQLGDGTYYRKSIPVQIDGLNDVVSISAGGSYVLALKSDGTVWSWGRNQAGQLGLGDTTNRNIPSQISTITNARAVYAVSLNSYIILDDNTVKSCGRTGNGMLGLGSQSANILTHTTIDLSNVEQLVVGSNHVFAIKKDGTLWGWGENNTNCLGLNNINGKLFKTPTRITSFTDYKTIYAGYSRTFIEKKDGTIWAIGMNNFGELGIGTNASVSGLIEIPTHTNVSNITSFGYSTTLLKDDGSIWSSGRNTYGQFGNRSHDDDTHVRFTQSNPIPGDVIVLASSRTNYSNNIVATKNKVYAWGYSSEGQLGIANNRYTYTVIPTEVDIIINSAPVINEQEIQSNIFLTEENKQTFFSLEVSDADSDPLTCKYYIDGNEVEAGSVVLNKTIGAKTATFPPLDLKALTEGVHGVKYTVNDGSVEKVAYSKFYVDYSSPKINDLQVEVKDGGIDVAIYGNDETSGIATNGYTYTLDNGTPIKSSSPYYHFSNIDKGERHNVTVTIEDMAGNTVTQSSEATVKAHLPVLSVSQVNVDQIKLVIATDNADDTQYQVACNNGYINALGEYTDKEIWMTLADKALVLKNMEVNTSYAFKIKARNKENIETPFTEPIIMNLAIELPPMPTNVLCSVDKDTASLSWDMMNGVKYYEMEKDGSDIITLTSPTYDDTKLEINTDHMYRIRGVSKYGEGEWTNYVVANISQGIPGLVQDVKDSPQDTSAVISWDGQYGVDAYQVIVNNIRQYETSSNYCELTGLLPNTSYTYRIKAINTVGESEWTSNRTFDTYGLPTPILSLDDVDEHRIEVSWKEVDGAGTYELKVDGSIVSMAGKRTYIHDSLLNNSSHTYQVRSVNAGDTSSWSAELPITTLPEKPEVPSDFFGFATDTFITLSWTEVPDAIGYDLEIDGVVIENDASNIYIHDELDPLTRHTYRIRSKNTLIESDWSSYIWISTLPTQAKPPKEVYISSVGTVSTIKWEKIPGSMNYDIEVDGHVYNAGNTGTYIHRGVTLGVEHKYRIRTKSLVGISEWSGYVVNNSIKAKSKKNKDLELGLTASHIKDFSKYELTVYYNKDVLKVVDLCSKTTDKELAPCYIEEENVTITSFKEGLITFTVDKPIEPGYDWTGIINNITFMGQLSGGTTIDYTVYIMPE